VLLEYALKLTRAPAGMTEADVEALREHGLDDRAIVDANQVVAYYNYVNRVADGLGVELEPSWGAEARRRRPYSRLNELPAVDADRIPWLSVEQMREVDRIAIEAGMLLEQMMENAGRNLAAVARRLLGGSVAGKRVAVFAGPGGNGGGGLVAARHLAAAGAAVGVALDRPPSELAPVTNRQHVLARAAGIQVSDVWSPADEPELVIDALLGYSQSGVPRDATAERIESTAGRRVLALDVPSGLELASGTLHDPHVRAEATLTLALPKEALRAAAAREAVGQLLLGDISVPAAVYERLGLTFAAPFASGPIVRVLG
jgi:NAD(P)H-hydrate epimerase